MRGTVSRNTAKIVNNTDNPNSDYRQRYASMIGGDNIDEDYVQKQQDYLTQTGNFTRATIRDFDNGFDDSQVVSVP